MEKIKKLYNKYFALYKKYEEQVNYIFFGGCTTILNIVAYYIFAHVINLDVNPSTALGNIIAIIFAYFTNRLWVFKDKANTPKGIAREVLSFLGARAATFILDQINMFIFVDKLKLPDMPIKIISTTIVIILNYVASKLFVFKKDKNAKA